MIKKNEQSDFWIGEGGNDYIKRNSKTNNAINNRVEFWQNILTRVDLDVNASVLEVGSNIGLNIEAIKKIKPINFFALEPNGTACEHLAKNNVLPRENIKQGLATKIDFSNGMFDLVFTCGVLIHISPSDLEEAINEIRRVSKKYIICCEYFSDKIQEIEYQGKEKLLFKRDFGSFFLDKISSLKLVDYGFAWKRVTGIDNLTWWIFEIK